MTNPSENTQVGVGSVSDTSDRSDRSDKRRGRRVLSCLAGAGVLLVASCAMDRASVPADSVPADSVPAGGATSCDPAADIFIPPPVTRGEENRLEFSLNERGLATLVHAGRSFLAGGHGGTIQPFAHTPRFDQSSEAEISTGGPTEQRLETDGKTVVRIFPWGEVSATYELSEPNNLEIAIRVENRTEAQLQRINLQVARLRYPEVPVVHAVGVSGTFKGGVFAAASSGQRPPVVLADYGHGSLLVGSASPEAKTAGFWSAEHEGLINRAGLVFENIPPGGVKEATLMLRFGPGGVAFRERGRDLLDAYVARHSMTLDWPDRRPIGKIFLATARVGPDQMETNPNRWFMNAKDIDVSTPEGKEAFRERLLKFAEGAVDALRHQHAQGGITWDPEGQRTGHTYYGDPRIIPDIAPEMEYRGEHELATIDAYFKVYADAGLHHGICVRPQRVRLEGQYWVQDELDDPEQRWAELDAKIGYAVDRWGSTLIYIDSDYNITAAQYRRLHECYPDVLLIPEWKQPLHYAYTAPLVSLFHHGVTGTPASVRDLWPDAFCVNLVDNLNQIEDTVRERVLAAFRAGDVPMVNAWYIHAGGETLRTLYETVRSPGRLPPE